MTQKEKLVRRFLSKPRNFTFNEMRILLRGYGYKEIRSGKTAGSRIAFFHEDIHHIIRLHKPHPNNILKKYQLDFIENESRKKEFLK